MVCQPDRSDSHKSVDLNGLYGVQERSVLSEPRTLLMAVHLSYNVSKSWIVSLPESSSKILLTSSVTPESEKFRSVNEPSSMISNHLSYIVSKPWIVSLTDSSPTQVC